MATTLKVAVSAWVMVRLTGSSVISGASSSARRAEAETSKRIMNTGKRPVGIEPANVELNPLLVITLAESTDCLQPRLLITISIPIQPIQSHKTMHWRKAEGRKLEPLYLYTIFS